MKNKPIVLAYLFINLFLIQTITAQSGNKHIYTVKRGESIKEIAIYYSVRASQIRKWNKIEYGILITPGQKLIIWSYRGWTDGQINARKMRPELFLPKDEFESTAEYNQRLQQQKDFFKKVEKELIAGQKAKKKEKERLAHEKIFEQKRKKRNQIAESLELIEFNISLLGKVNGRYGRKNKTRTSSY